MSTRTEAQAEAQTAVPEAHQKFGKLMRSSLIGGSRAGNPVVDALAEHFGADPVTLPLVQEEYPYHLGIVEETGLNAFLAEPGRESHETGVVVPNSGQVLRWFSDLLLPPSLPRPAPRFGPVEEHRRLCGFDKWMRVRTRSLVFVRDDEGPSAIWVEPRFDNDAEHGVRVEVMALTAERAAAILADIHRLGTEHSPYRGECFSMLVPRFYIKPQFEERPSGIQASDVILPAGLLEEIEQHVVGVARHGAQLDAAGCHRKRGLLLWGRPGTGKTHLIRYLAGRLPDHTIMLLPGKLMDNLERLQEMVAYCQPGIVVLDDVDYIAQDRNLRATMRLYDLLAALDGVRPDVDLLFILTTNRVEALDPAITARPGRIDQAVEIPPPDDSCRRRLIELYSKGVALEVSDEQLDSVVARTDGVTASFFKELLRRATLYALGADQGSEAAELVGVGDGDRSAGAGGSGGKVVVGEAHLTKALDVMLDPDSPLTQRLLGRADGDGDEDPPA